MSITHPSWPRGRRSEPNDPPSIHIASKAAPPPISKVTEVVDAKQDVERLERRAAVFNTIRLAMSHGGRNVFTTGDVYAIELIEGAVHSIANPVPIGSPLPAFEPGAMDDKIGLRDTVVSAVEKALSQGDEDGEDSHRTENGPASD